MICGERTSKQTASITHPARIKVKFFSLYQVLAFPTGLAISAIFCLLFSPSLFAQETGERGVFDCFNRWADCDIEPEEPVFPGGEKALAEFITGNLQFTEEMKALNTYGIVYVQFVVDTTGSVSEVEMKRGLHPLMDAEAMRVVSSMPRWKPAVNCRKQPMCVRYVIPINFKKEIVEEVEEDVVIMDEVYVADDSLETADTTYAEDCWCCYAEPSFPGGESKFHDFVLKNYTFSQEMKDLRISGRIWLQFVVNADGSISDIVAVRGLHPLLDAEAVRIFTIMPAWVPAENGCEKPVRMRYTVPITVTNHY